MTKKHRTIKAIEKLIKKYKHPQGQSFFSITSCPLCNIHGENAITTCRGCPLANYIGDEGCDDFNTFIKASAIYLTTVGPKYTKEKYEPFPLTLPTPQEFLERAKFFEKLLPLLEEVPSKYFTKTGWAYFDNLINIASIEKRKYFDD